MRRAILFFYVMIFSVFSVNAQHNSIYSQYYFSGVLINPAYAGSQGALNFTSLFRRQWTGFEGAPQNISVGIHSPLKKKKVALGLLFINNSFGVTTENKVLAIYAYRIHLGSGSLAFGLQGGLSAVRNNWSAVNTTQQDDPVFMTGGAKINNLEFGYGMYYNNSRFFAGVSSPFLYTTAVDGKFSDSPVIFAGGGIVRLGENYALKPSAMVKYIVNSPVQADVTATLYLHDVVGIGAGCRSGDAAYAFFDLNLNQQLSFGYCYDYTLSKLSRYSAGSHEIMLRYLFHYRVNLQSVRYF